MTLTLTLSAATLDQLRTAAESQGLSLETYAVKVLVTHAAMTKKSYREIFAPIHAAVKRSGAIAEEIDQLIDEAVAESRAESDSSSR